MTTYHRKRGDKENRAHAQLPLNHALVVGEDISCGELCNMDLAYGVIVLGIGSRRRAHAHAGLIEALVEGEDILCDGLFNIDLV
jgi:hypothetical protein